MISEVFWLDLTHVRPYPLLLLDAMFRDAGFQIADAGHYQSFGLARRQLPRRLLLRALLGKHYGKQNTFIVGEVPGWQALEIAWAAQHRADGAADDA